MRLDGFWQLDCTGEMTWNFDNILPEYSNKNIKLLVANSLQMGWIKLPPHFYEASETGQDVKEKYIKTPSEECP